CVVGRWHVSPARRIHFGFQAGDGIRAFHVTGVQTCALPIYYLNVFSFPLIHGSRDNALSDKKSIVLTEELASRLFGTADAAMGRSAERRVRKGWRARCWLHRGHKTEGAHVGGRR